MNPLRRYLAKRKLARMVEERRNSFDVVNYRRHRAAALKHTRARA
jgi:hypothetical protein